MNIAINTGGGDAPGLNAVIRAVVLAALNQEWKVYGIRRGYVGLMDGEGVIPLDRDSVRGITHLGGTILGTTNRGNPFEWPAHQADGSVVAIDRSDEVLAGFRRYGLDALIAIGGDGSLRIAQRFAEKGLPVVGVPKTIDNDLAATEVTFGFDTAVQTAAEAIDKLHSTAESHERVMVVELMGRNTGWIALHAGLAATADAILIPEIPYDINSVCEKIREREREGRHFSIIVVAEGAMPKGGQMTYMEEAKPGQAGRLGGIGEHVAMQIEELTGKETRTLVLGHLQRGGRPTPFDRLMALRFGTAAVRCVQAGHFGTMVAYQPPAMTHVALEEAIHELKRVPVDHDTVRTGRDLGISFGD
ncbi:MAG TPA: ATP-dependent 6-phosphofructokinase [Longimicrobiales bacterium]|nr:ATP-dependent 6-phosphofructokinase [Longimicrobiales bacterium]